MSWTPVACTYPDRWQDELTPEQEERSMQEPGPTAKEQAEARQAADPAAQPSAVQAPPEATTGDGEPTKEELYEEAQTLDVEGRSEMSKGELRKAVRKARGE